MEKNNNLTNKIVIHKNVNGVQFLQFKKLLKYSEKLNHAYSLGLDMDFKVNKKINEEKIPLNEEKIKKVEKCLEKICNSYSVNNSDYKNVIIPIMDHTDNIKIVYKKLNNEEPDINNKEYQSVDSLITNKKNKILTLTNADCILMFFYDTKNNVIASVHSGWRGTLKRISQKTVKEMQIAFNSKQEDIICAIMPSIRKCHFEVSEDVCTLYKEEFKKEIKENSEIISKSIKKKEKWHIDTVLINKIILENMGIKKENILDSNICSVCNSDLIHSYRVEKEELKVNASFIELI